ncbi:MAG: phosphoglycerate dehydrogenase [Candidatus Marinimicrobia bacterium]|nr:phosphoglycerate dehydrogenase [Candidatus Neomarinimicrobiota bacterium]
MSFKVLITDPISDEGIDLLKESDDFEIIIKPDLNPAELLEAVRDVDAHIVRSGTSVSSELIEAAKRLKVICRAGVGVDNIDIDAATKKGIVVMNVPGVNSNAAAEHTMALMLALSRNVAYADKSVKEGRWERAALTGTELKNKKLGVVGFGKVGKEVALRANAFEMEVQVYDPYVSNEVIEENGMKPAEFNKLLGEVDYITLHMPLNEDTKYIINKKSIAKMKKGVRIINCARGGLIEEKELKRALDSGKVAGAALDVFENEPPDGSPILEADNVLLTPHLGASTEEAKMGISLEACRQVRDYLVHKKAKNALNVAYAGGELSPMMEPFVELAGKIGRMQSQLTGGEINEMKITCKGDLNEVTPIALSVLMGFISHSSTDPINNVNAHYIAKQRGIKVTESYEHSGGNYKNIVESVVDGPNGKLTVKGTLFAGKHIRLVQIDEYHMEVKPEGIMLVIKSDDKPGVIGKIGTILGNHNQNIAEFNLGRRKKGGIALSLVNLDFPLPHDVMEKLTSEEDILSVNQVSF